MHIPAQTINNKLKMLVIVATILLAILFAAQTVHAQEITPAPGTYSYGSTSEFSPYVALTSSGTLAPTGDSQTTGYIAVATLLVASAGMMVLALRKNKSLI